MHGQEFFFQALVFLAAAVVSVPIAKRLGLGSVLGYLAAGVAIGPFALGLVGEEGQDVLHFAEFGVVMMLFLVGLELKPSLLWRLRIPVLGLGGLQVTLTAAALSILGLVFGLRWQVSVAVGMILALSSTAIVLQTLTEKGLLRTDGGQSSFAVLLFQDMAVIPILAVLPLLAVAGGSAEAYPGSWVQEQPTWLQTILVLAAVSAIVLTGRYLLRPVFRIIAAIHLREIFSAAALLLVIAIALLMDAVGLSPALGTFLAGVVLASSEYRHELEADIEPFKGLLLGLFFIAVGASIDWELIGARLGLVAALVLGLVVLKSAVLFVLGWAFRMGLDQRLLFTFALAQGSEFAFVLLSFATTAGVLSGSVAGTLVATVALSMALSPLLMLANDRLLQPRLGTREADRRPDDSIDEENPVIIVGFGSFGSIVGRFLAANGVGATFLDVDSDKVDLLRKLGLKVFYGDACRHELLTAAGAEKARLLVIAVDDPQKTLEIVDKAGHHFPHLAILARAIGRTHAYELLDRGVSHVYRETLDSSLRMGIDSLRLLGRRAHQVHRSAAKFRCHDEDSIHDLARHRHDRSEYISRARQRIHDLEQTLLSDLEEGESTDSAWDVESLREELSQENPE